MLLSPTPQEYAGRRTSLLDDAPADTDAVEPSAMEISLSRRSSSLNSFKAGARKITRMNQLARTDRVAADNRMSRPLEAGELRPAAVALALQLGLGAANLSHDEGGAHAARTAGDTNDPARVVPLPARLRVRRAEGDAVAEMPLPGASCVELAPATFARARAAFGLSARVYRATLRHPHAAAGGAGKPLWPTLGTMAGAGKSGASFFTSSDQRFILKTTRHAAYPDTPPPCRTGRCSPPHPALASAAPPRRARCCACCRSTCSTSPRRRTRCCPASTYCRRLSRTPDQWSTPE